MSDFYEAVTARCGLDAETVRRILDTYLIEPRPQYPRPRRLLLEKLSFSGTKHLPDHDPEPFSFEIELSSGVWCFASHDSNLVGKTSVLEIVRWALTGRPYPQDDVRKWLERVELQARVEQEQFTVSFRVVGGEAIDGALQLTAGDRPLAMFSGETQFEQELGAFFMDRLGLEATPYWQKLPHDDQGTRTSLGWVGYAGILHMSNSAHRIVLGEHLHQTTRLIYAFVGIPWALTRASANVVKNQLSQDNTRRKRRRETDAAARNVDLETLRAELSSLEMRLGAIAEPASDINALDAALDALREVDAELIEARAQVSAQSATLSLLSAAVLAEHQRLVDQQESAHARRFFHTLNPTMCPRCDTPITTERRNDAAAHSACAVCTTELNIEDDESEETDDVETQLADASTERDRAAEELAGLEAAVTSLEERRISSRADADQLAAQRSVESDRRGLEIERAVLEGRLRERTAILDGVAGDEPENHDLAVVTAAEKEAEERLVAAAGTLFDDLNAEIVRLGHRFGIEALETATLKRNGQLSLRKGGENTSFGRVTPGERLRLKIAVVVAMLRVGQNLGVGRHPGLLLIDSPGADEIEADDFTSILGELAAVASELEHLQVLTTSASADLVLSVLPPDRVTVAEKGKPLW